MEKLIVIRSLFELQFLLDYLSDFDFEYLAFDIETTGTDKDAKVIGFSICAEVDLSYYVILQEWDVATSSLRVLETNNKASVLLKSIRHKKLICHNAVFDCAMVMNNFGVDLMPSVHTDTMLLAHLLDENRSCGLKELAVSIYGEDVRKEQQEMKASVSKNGGSLTKDNYELYKADSELIAKYGAKDAILTLKLFYHLVPELYEQGLDRFFYDDETMPLLRGPTYQLNTVGLRVDPEKLQNLKATLEAEIMEAKAFIHQEIFEHVKDKYPGTAKAKTFNISAGKQLAWLLFERLGNEFVTLTDSGRELCRALDMKVPYSPAAKREFVKVVKENKDRVYEEASFNKKTGKMSRPKKVADYWHYLSSDKVTLAKFSKRYKWVEKLLEYNKNTKLLSTYVIGIQERLRYNIIYPSFLQHGTTSGRYSSRSPNFQNLPKEDKRIKSCIVARPGMVFVGADYSQLEPRVFASISQDETLMKCFEKGEDFYSIVGIPIFGKEGLSAFKNDENSFAKKHPELRDVSKAFSLATPYGTSAFQQSQKLGKKSEECQEIINKYFAAYPKVELMMLESHEQAKANGVVYNLYGRPRRIPEAKEITKIYGNVAHSELPYAARTLLNLGMNHRVQSSAASIMNRAAIAVHEHFKNSDVNIVLQVHDQLVLEGPKEKEEEMKTILKDRMENVTKLPGVLLAADPFVSTDLSGQK